MEPLNLTPGEIKALKALLFCEMGDSVHELFEEQGANAHDCLDKLEAAVEGETCPVCHGDGRSGCSKGACEYCLGDGTV